MKPSRIFVVRHGESIGNIDKSVYKDIPDYALGLTPLGNSQAYSTGRKISQHLEHNPSIQFYISPFWRTRQTYISIRRALDDYPNPIGTPKYKFYEDPRLREQEWGQNMESREGYKYDVENARDSYGHFYYRFRDGGESCADVFDRVSDFMNTLHRDFKKKDYSNNVIIVTHGMTMRLFIMRWFHCSVEEFESWGNPGNGEYFLLERKENEKYELVTPLKKHNIKHNFQFDFGKYKDLFPFPNKLPYQ